MSSFIYQDKRPLELSTVDPLIKGPCGVRWTSDRCIPHEPSGEAPLTTVSTITTMPAMSLSAYQAYQANLTLYCTLDTRPAYHSLRILDSRSGSRRQSPRKGRYPF